MKGTTVNTTPRSLVLHGTVHVWPTTQRLYDGLGQELLTAARCAVDQRGMFHLALSGGSTPKPFYERLAQGKRYQKLPWESTHLWVVDERRVPENDDRNNFRMIAQALAHHVPVPIHHLHSVPVLADDPADAYEHELRTMFGFDSTPQLDFVLLGMGDDGHTASLFPHSPALSLSPKLVANNVGPHVTPPPRVTMTYQLLNAARDVVVLVTGPSKAATLRRVDQQLRHHGPDPHTLPITGIRPTKGQLTWHLDTAATADS